MKSARSVIGRCVDIFKDIVLGRETGSWVLAALLLAAMDAKEIGDTCPFCGKKLGSRQGMVNHVLLSRCYNKLVEVCLRAHDIDRKISGRYFSRTSKRVKLYIPRVGDITCEYGDIKCVAEEIKKLVSI